MNTWIAQNLQWIITGAVGIIVWLIRLEGKQKADRQKFEMALQALKDNTASEFGARDANLKALKEVTDHLTRMGEKMKEELPTIRENIMEVKTKLNIILDRLPKP